MQQVLLSPFNNQELQNQASNYVNQLSALYSIPLIEFIYYNGCTIEQLQRIKTVFDFLISIKHYNDAFNLFLSLYQHMSHTHNSLS